MTFNSNDNELQNDILQAQLDDIFRDVLETPDNTIWTPQNAADFDPEHWREPVVDMEEFVLSSEYLNCQTVYPKVMDILWELDKPEIREAYLALGKGSGKSFISSIMKARMIYKLLCLKNPQLFFGKADGSQLLTLNLSVSRDQARDVIFGSFLNMVKASKWFEGKFKERTHSVEFPNNIFAFSGHSKSTSWLGYNTILGILDEASWHLDNNERSVADELYSTLIGSCKTRFPWAYKIIVISSVREYDDFLLSKIDYVKEKGEHLEVGEDRPHRFQILQNNRTRGQAESQFRGF